MGTHTDRFIHLLTQRHRVIVLGGLAVIGHGLSRATYDGDIWLEPMADSDAWADALAEVTTTFGGLTLHRLPGWTEITVGELTEAVGESRVIRILGLNCPLDVFRKPNEFDAEMFEAVYARGSRRSDGTVLPEPLDLIQSKMDTGRQKDLNDIAYLETVVRADYKERLPTATLAEACAMLERYSEWQVLQATLTNPSPEVRELAMTQLHEFAEAGDPFSQAILAGREIP